MDLPLQMPCSRHSRFIIRSIASSYLGRSSPLPPASESIYCPFRSVTPGTLHCITRSSSFSWRLSWSDEKTRKAFEGDINNGGSFLAREKLKVLARKSTEDATQRNNFRTDKNKGSSPRKDRRPLNVNGGDAFGSSGKGTITLKGEVQRAGTDATDNLSRGKVLKKGYRHQSGVSGTVSKTSKNSQSGVSGTVSKTSKNSIPNTGRAGFCASPKSFRAQSRSSHTQCLEEEVRVTMDSTIQSSNQNGGRKFKRPKKNPEEAETWWKLNMCSKYGDLKGALEIFDRVRKEGVVKFKQHNYNVLLYICSGAASGVLIRGKSGKDDGSSGISSLRINKEVDKDIEKSEMDVEPSFSDSKSQLGEGNTKVEASGGEEIVFSKEEMDLAARRGFEVYEDMLNAGVPLNEASFTSIARLAVAKGDGDLAFEMVKKMAAANIAPKLRSYGPALFTFCKNNEVEKAFEVDAHMLAAGVLHDESQLEALLKVSAQAGLEDKVYSLLQRLRTTVRELSPSTVETIEQWFNSEAAVLAGKQNCENLPTMEELTVATEAGGGGWHGLGWLGKGRWKVKRTNINKMGECLCCRERLCTIDIDPQETDNFAKSVAELACQRELMSNEFRAFQRWVDQREPFDAIVDGANVGLYQQNFNLGGFNFHQLNAVVKAIQARSSTKRLPLIILHRRRTREGAALSANAQQLLQSWIQADALYATPPGSNDDWYWLYAAVKCKCLLLTNDEMRDHLFELLGNDFFPKWKERHQVRFTFTSHKLELHMPPPYSIIIQESQKGSWHVPQIGGDDISTPREWLCVTRPEYVKMESASADDVACQSGVVTKTLGSYPDQSTIVTGVDYNKSKLLALDSPNPSDEDVSLESSDTAKGQCSPSSSRSTTARSSSPKKGRRKTQPILVSPSSPSQTLVKLEEAEKHGKSAIDFQI